MPDQEDSTYKRVTVTLTKAAVDLLTRECEHRRSLEGARVAPARIINELILRYLRGHRDGASPSAEKPPSKRLKKSKTSG